MSLSNPANISAEVIASLSDALRAQVPYYAQNFQPNLYAAATVCFVAAWVANGLRVYSRRLKCQKSGWDDYMTLVALGFYVPFYVASIFVINLGTGRHQVVAVVEHPENVRPAAKAGVATVILYLFPLYFIKLSTLFLYHRIFGGASLTFTRTAWALGIFITATHVFNLVVFFTACIPLAQYWSYAPGGFCIQTKVPYIVGSVLFAVSDAVVLLFPMPLIWRMRTSWRRRLQITGIFLLGSFVVAIGIVKAVLISRFSPASPDHLWDTSLPVLMANLENGLAAVAACLPVLRPVFNKCVYGSIETPTTPTAATPGASAAGGMDEWMRTIGGRKILASGNGLSAGWTETTIVSEKRSSGPGSRWGHSRGDSRVESVCDR